METRLYQPISPVLRQSTAVPREKRESIWKKFISWCESQEQHRFGWLAAIVAGHGCIITPLLLVVITFTGNNFIFWPLAIAGMAAPLIANLSAMPTKITIPVFFASLLLDAAILVLCISQLVGFSLF